MDMLVEFLLPGLPRRLQKKLRSSPRAVTRSHLEKLQACDPRRQDKLVTLHYVMGMPWEEALEQCSPRSRWGSLCRQLNIELRMVAEEDPAEARRLRDSVVARVDETLLLVTSSVEATQP